MRAGTSLEPGNGGPPWALLDVDRLTMMYAEMTMLFVITESSVSRYLDETMNLIVMKLSFILSFTLNLRNVVFAVVTHSIDAWPQVTLVIMIEIHSDICFTFIFSFT